MSFSNKAIPLGGRASPLSQAQLKEVCDLFPHLSFSIHLMESGGDKDKQTSLRGMEKNDFFTREIDDWVLAGEGRLAVHSAKDLPFPLREGLSLFCLTEGIDPSDAFVCREGHTLESLPAGSRVATSSERREAVVRSLRPDLSFCDLRGTIEERLAKVERGEVDAIVVATAALIRLKLKVPYTILPGETAEGQGKLAIIGRAVDPWEDVFSI